MPGPHPAVAATRCAARDALDGLPGDALILIACSGGPDSLALAAAAAFEAPRAGVRAGAVVVDHGLQGGSATVAEDAARACRNLGLAPVEVLAVDCSAPAGGPEARARQARYEALGQAARRHGAAAVWLGHTLDDQAEQVLLGLCRGSGTRSLAGMARRRGVYVRPFLRVDHATTQAACAAQDLQPWRDLTNEDPSFLRNRVRRALADLEADLGPGLAQALARSADLARQDADLLDGLAAEARAALGAGPWPAAALAALPAAIRARVWRLSAAEARAGSLSAAHVAALDALVTSWRGQGPVALPGGVVGRRTSGRVSVTAPGRQEWGPAAPPADRPGQRQQE